MKSTPRIGLWIGGCFIGAFLLLALCAGGGFIIEIPFFLGVGWVFYLARVLPQVTVSPGNITIGLMALAVSLILAHVIASWLWNHLYPEKRWQLLWTWRVYMLILLTFASGICLLAVTHQCYWIVSGPQPFIESHMPGVSAARQSAAISTVAAVDSNLDLYRSQHGGNYPTQEQMKDWSSLTKKTDAAGNITPNGPFGPYISLATANPFTNKLDIVPAASPSISAGWTYDETNGRIQAIIPSHIAEQMDDGFFDGPQFLVMPEPDKQAK